MWAGEAILTCCWRWHGFVSDDENQKTAPESHPTGRVTQQLVTWPEEAISAVPKAREVQAYVCSVFRKELECLENRKLVKLILVLLGMDNRMVISFKNHILKLLSLITWKKADEK